MVPLALQYLQNHAQISKSCKLSHGLNAHFLKLPEEFTTYIIIDSREPCESFMSMWVATIWWALAIQSMPCSCCRVNNYPRHGASGPQYLQNPAQISKSSSVFQGPIPHNLEGRSVCQSYYVPKFETQQVPFLSRFLFNCGSGASIAFHQLGR